MKIYSTDIVQAGDTNRSRGRRLNRELLYWADAEGEVFEIMEAPGQERNLSLSVGHLAGKEAIDDEGNRLFTIH